MDTVSPHLQWTPAPCPERPGWFHLLRYDQVDEQGNPVGAPTLATSPGGSIRQLPSQERAQMACDWFNGGEGMS